ncbi:mechanosensory transduction mediator stumble [Rhynchophorus ferrugineus]|uniref:mechanosensory transduction mediator stumble n=1 Tax=Rhynchophorus ferrugineus TaxID=354439 RepID=UPI003FCE6806
MRSPEHQSLQRAGKNFEEDLDMHYLAPGAFTVLPTDASRLPDPPPAPPPYKLTSSTRRNKHQSFAIIGEVAFTGTESRNISPTGRVSPFKGHGFNPLGSRHASPVGSPVPPDDPRSPSPNRTSSKIPKPSARPRSRKDAAGAVFGEKVSHIKQKTLNRQLSQSLTNLEPRKVQRRPPPSPRRRARGGPAFKQLSPIMGSSPEPSQSLSSPSRIPVKSKSTPPSRLPSPTRVNVGSKPPSRSSSKTNLHQGKDSVPSTKIPINRYHHIQSKINTNKPKVPPKPPISSSDENDSPRKMLPPRRNSINRTSSRPNLLPKTYMGNKNQNYTSDSSVNNEPVDVNKTKPGKMFGSTVSTKSVSNSTVHNKTISGSKTSSGKTVPKNKQQTETASVPKTNLDDVKPINTEVTSSEIQHEEEHDKTSSNLGSKIDPATSDTDFSDLPASATTVVSSTTNTVAKPLKIDTPTFERSKAVSPMIDGRVLSATSVSHAINKMNDTVLNTKTLIKDSGLHTRITPSPNTATSITPEAPKSENNENKTKNIDNKPSEGQNTDTVTKSKTQTDSKHDKDEPINDKSGKTPTLTEIPSKDKQDHTQPSQTDSTKPTLNNNTQPTLPDKKNPEIHGTTTNHNSNLNHSNHQTYNSSKNHSNNHVATIGLGNAKALEMEVQNNMSKLIGSMDSSLGDVPIDKLSANDRIREARTVIAGDVKPIRITVREKASDVDVQSGNVAPHFGISNGVTDRPGLPPAQPNTPPPHEPEKQDVPPNKCKRILKSCTKVLTCNRCSCCKRAPKVEEVQEEPQSSGCFKCLKKSKKTQGEQIRINIEDENGVEKKPTCWEKIKCCKKNKVGDNQSCFPIGKRKESWAERRTESIIESDEQNKAKCCSKDGCKNFFRKIFCCCCKKKEEIIPPDTRKESLVSGKKKSLTPTTLPPPEDTKPKIDNSLVEHTSHMKGAIPVLPVCLAWFCCIMNCIGPGTGTILSGLFCLCIGKPRFSQKDGPKPRIGAFIIDVIIGFSQFFTVLFCLVGWGWSIWWGVIMVKVAKKHRKLKQLEHFEEQTTRPAQLPGDRRRDIERGKT